MNIQKLEWDSNLFGYEVGKVTIADENVDLQDILNLNDVFRLMYLESKVAIDKKELDRSFIKVTYSKQVETLTPHLEAEENLRTEKLTGKFTDQLLNLSFQSGMFSRFKLDPNFRNNEFMKLYTKWVENSLSGEVADTVEAVKDSDSNIIGFVTIKFNPEFSEIGLIAVNNQKRRLGVGSLLLKKVNQLSVEKQCSKIIVSTQQDNYMACKFYEKNGFKKISKSYIYHLWLN